MINRGWKWLIIKFVWFYKYDIAIIIIISVTFYLRPDLIMRLYEVCPLFWVIIAKIILSLMMIIENLLFVANLVCIYYLLLDILVEIAYAFAIRDVPFEVRFYLILKLFFVYCWLLFVVYLYYILIVKQLWYWWVLF